MPIRNLFTLISLLLLTYYGWSAEVDTITTHSSIMHKDIKAVVITPDTYTENKQFPVVYLLHGYSGNYSNWIRKVPALQEYADQHEMIIVCPDGNFGSWYLDSPKIEESKYETYVAKELVDWIDTNYSTKANPEGRAITGLSMGGHGAFYLAFKHQDVFGMAGSMSGGLDITPFPNNWELSKLLGSYAQEPENWEAHSVINLTHHLTPNSLELIISCGTDDFFYPQNVKLHEKLTYHNIPHTFISAPGAHTWEFWEDTVKYHLQFFNDRFTRSE